MCKTGKTFALLLSLIIALPCLTMLIVGAANAQTSQAPSAPDFTVTYSSKNGRGMAEIKITNQPIDSLYYVVETKDHFQANWSVVYRVPPAYSKLDENPYLKQNSTSDYTIIKFSFLESDYAHPEYIPSSGLLDFKVQALIGEPYYIPIGERLPLYGLDKIAFGFNDARPSSEWSQIQTLNLADGTVSPTKNPTSSQTPTSSTTPTPPTQSPTSTAPYINTGPHMPESEPFPTLLLVAASVIIAVVVASVLLFRKHRKTAS
jgi:hypothetical protein